MHKKDILLELKLTAEESENLTAVLLKIELFDDLQELTLSRTKARYGNQLLLDVGNVFVIDLNDPRCKTLELELPAWMLPNLELLSEVLSSNKTPKGTQKRLSVTAKELLTILKDYQ